MNFITMVSFISLVGMILPFSKPAYAEKIYGYTVLEVLESGDAYFIPVTLDRETLSGELFYRKSKKCFNLKEIKKSYSKLTRTPRDCSKKILVDSKIKPIKIKDFKKYLKVLIGCIDKQDRTCLIGLMSPKLVINSSAARYGDRRVHLLDSMKKKDFDFMRNIFTKPIKAYKESAVFRVKESGESYDFDTRGHFIFEDGFWKLNSYKRLVLKRR